MKQSRFREILKEEIQTAKKGALVDQIYDILRPIKGFNELGLDQQGELSMQVVKLLNKYGLK